jgi:hypothetical protein
VYNLNGTAAALSLQFMNSSISGLNANGSFDYWAGSRYYGLGVLNSPLGAFCLAFKGQFIGFQMGFDYQRSFLGQPSLFYSFPGTCRTAS